MLREPFSELKRIIPKITFARRDEVKKYLDKFGLDLDKGDYKCVICGERVTSENVGIIVNGSKVIVVCNKPTCMEKANILTLYREA